MLYTGNPVNGMNRGVAIDTVKLELGTKHTEANSLTQAMGPKEQYLGLLKLWNQYEIINTPLLNATELKKNVIYTNTLGQSLSYSVPIKFTLPYVTHDINGDGEKLGLNKDKFYLILNTNRYTKSDILTYDFYNGKQAYVDLDSEVIPYNGGWQYTMRLTDTDPKAFISRRFVQPGVEWVKVGNFQTEWSTEASTINNDSDGLTTLMFKTGQTLQSVEHWITGHAAMIEYNTNRPGDMDMSIMGQYKNPTQAAVMYMFETLGDPKDPNNPDRRKNPVPGSGTWIPMILKMLILEQAKMQENHYMYSTGGTVTDGRGTEVRRGLGYYPQLKSSSNYHTYTRPEQIGPRLRQITGDIFFGRKDLPLHERRVKYKMGMGAYIEFQKYCLEKFKQNIIFPVWAQHDALKGMLTGDNMNLRYGGYRFTAFNFPEAGWIEVEHDPALDWTGTKNQSGFIGNYPTQSYRVFVEDITDGAFSNAMPPAGAASVGDGFNNGSNVTLIKPLNYAEVYTSYEVGAFCPDFLKTYVGAGGNAHIASSNRNGFSVRMQWAGEVWLKDPSRSLLLELQDPLQTL